MVPDSMSATAVPLTLSRPLAATHVVHSIPGRVRLRVPTLKDNSHLTRCLQALLSAQAGVTEVTVAPVCHSVTVMYDSVVWTPESLCIFLQARTQEELNQYESVALPEVAASSFTKTWLQPWRFLNTTESELGSTATLQADGPARSGYWRVGYASMVVGVAMFAVPGVPGVPFLILSTYCFSKATKTRNESDVIAQIPKAG